MEVLWLRLSGWASLSIRVKGRKSQLSWATLGLLKRNEYLYSLLSEYKTISQAFLPDSIISKVTIVPNLHINRAPIVHDISPHSHARCPYVRRHPGTFCGTIHMSHRLCSTYSASSKKEEKKLSPMEFLTSCLRQSHYAIRGSSKSVGHQSAKYDEYPSPAMTTF